MLRLFPDTGSRSKLNGTRAGLCVLGMMLSASCYGSGGAWLSMCADQPVSSLNDRDGGYLAHILDDQEKASVLRLTVTPPEASGCEALELPVSVDDVIWAGFVKPEVAKAKQIAVQGHTSKGRFAVSEVVAVDDSSVPARPSPAGKLQPSGKVRLLPPLRASWFWSPASWIDTPQRIFDSQASLGFKRIYITVPVTEGRVQHAEQLRQFLQLAHQRGLQVWGVLGDPYAVLDRERESFLERVGAYQAFNTDNAQQRLNELQLDIHQRGLQVRGGLGHPYAALGREKQYFLEPVGGDQTFNTDNAQQRLDGLQLDIEPYILPGYQLNPAVWLQKQAAIINASHQIAPSLALDIVLPFWFEPLHGDGAELLSNVEANIASITVMNYRTDPEQIREFADKFLYWGEREQKAVFIALESLSLPEEERNVYRQAEHGELWSFVFKKAPILLLLQHARDLPEGKAYSFSHGRKIDGSDTSFSSQPDKLMKLLPALDKQFGAWSSFAGIALHGLEKP